MIELAATEFTICYGYWKGVCAGGGVGRRGRNFTHAANATYLFQTRAEQNMKDVPVY